MIIAEKMIYVVNCVGLLYFC